MSARKLRRAVGLALAVVAAILATAAAANAQDASRSQQLIQADYDWN